MTTFQSRKIFPLRLPDNFHGALPPKQTLVDINKGKIQDRPFGNPQQLSPTKKVTTWQKKRFDNDIIKEKRQMVIHPAKVSQQNPDWVKTTYDCFRRNSIQPRIKQTRSQWQSYDVFGRPRQISYATNSIGSMRISEKISVTSKIGYEDRFRSVGAKQVTPKVGSLEFRDISIRKPQMKVGKTDFIDTYSPF